MERMADGELGREGARSEWGKGQPVEGATAMVSSLRLHQGCCDSKKEQVAGRAVGHVRG
jgi:hypothetical protein